MNSLLSGVYIDCVSNLCYVYPVYKLESSTTFAKRCVAFELPTNVDNMCLNIYSDYLKQILLDQRFLPIFVFNISIITQAN